MTKLHLQVVELSKNANIKIPSKQNRESQKKIFPQNTSYRNNRPYPQTKKEEGHLIAGYHSPEMSASQCNGKAGIQCLHVYPVVHFLFQLHD